MRWLYRTPKSALFKAIIRLFLRPFRHIPILQMGNLEMTSRLSPSASESRCKARVLAWLLSTSLHDEEASTACIWAIAGLPLRPDIQAELLRWEVVHVLKESLPKLAAGFPNNVLPVKACMHALLRIIVFSPGYYERYLVTKLFHSVEHIERIGENLENLPDDAYSVSICIRFCFAYHIHRSSGIGNMRDDLSPAPLIAGVDWLRFETGLASASDGVKKTLDTVSEYWCKTDTRSDGVHGTNSVLSGIRSYCSDIASRSQRSIQPIQTTCC